MANIWTIFKREFGGYFNSPIAYVFMVIFLASMGILFFLMGHYWLQGTAEMRSYFNLLQFVFMIFVPGLAMRLWSEERKLGTEELLLTLPIRTHEIVLGKYLAGLSLLAIALVLTGFIPVAIGYLGDPDWGPIIVGYVGAILVGALFLALGSFISSLTGNQILAFVISLISCAILIFLGHPGFVAELKANVGGLGEALASFGVMGHFENAQKGILDLRDLIYYVSMTALFLFLNHFAVENRKY
ncbi:MAG: ABC-2 transporter permease [Planctomycetes bacterium]|nr:ABC-2 transporter permease [Planctomycetota bacterium]